MDYNPRKPKSPALSDFVRRPPKPRPYLPPRLRAPEYPRLDLPRLSDLPTQMPRIPPAPRVEGR